ncbi:phage tail protein [Achromobacter sp. DH1f]|uniref:phage tail protein n=1 Tax=Achromobacter sp. DH1f TaxID=1397275 RepID=UPI00046A610F|nr:phage tail protein [Achromobacter sp. DH1f]
MARLLTLRRNLARLLRRDEVDDNFVNVASDFAGGVDPATLAGAYVLPYMRWADTGTGWLKRRNAANDGWTQEQRLLRRTVQPFNAGELPTSDGGAVYVNGQGMAEWDAAAGKYRVKSAVPLGAVALWPLRSSIPAGQIPADGQTISRATFPDLAQMVIDGKLPVVAEADWVADPLKRGSYTLGDGSTTIRLPDYNGQAAGSVGALFMRGDGAMSSGANGVIQRDAIQNINGTFDIGWGALLGRLAMDPSRQVSGPLRYNLGPGSGRVINSDLRSGYSDYLESYTFDASLVARTATETRPSNVSGVWTIQTFGVVVNPGSADAAQLASDYAVLNAAVQTQGGKLQVLDGQFQTLKSKAFGVDQAWIGFTPGAGAGQRMTTVTYTNSTSRPIIVAIQFSTTGNNGYLIGFVNGKSVAFGSWGPSGSGLGINFIVPSGSTYQVDAALAANIEWREYR